MSLIKATPADIHNMALKNIGAPESEVIDGAMPDIKMTIDCETHGTVELDYYPRYETLKDRYQGKPSKSYSVSKYCKKCLGAEMERLYTEQKAEEVKAREDAIHNKFIKTLENRGVSLRNADVRLDDLTPRNDKQAEALGAMISMREAIKTGGKCGNLILIGSVGTGKTMLTSGLVCDLLIEKKSPALSRVIDIIREMKDTWRKDSDQTELQLIAEYVNLDLLIIDEIGVQFGSDTEKMFIFDIIDGRYNKMKPTILISNLPMDGIKECIGERCIDRLREDGGKVIAFDFDSQRGRR